MNLPDQIIKELQETPSVHKANRLLQAGWRLLTITENRRGHIYILCAVTVLDVPAATPPTLRDESHRA